MLSGKETIREQYKNKLRLGSRSKWCEDRGGKVSGSDFHAISGHRAGFLCFIGVIVSMKYNSRINPSSFTRNAVNACEENGKTWRR